MAGLSSLATPQRVTLADLPAAIRQTLGPVAQDQASFDRYVSEIETDTLRRVAEGDREHLIYYALQSRRFTARPPIEPAISARRFVDHLPADQRTRLLDDASFVPPGGLPSAERSRLADLIAAKRADARLTYFKTLLHALGNPSSPDAFYSDYVRVARFLFNKEFAAGGDADRIAALYQTRPHSSDTQIDANFAVHTALGVIRALDPPFRVRRALIVGPGLDLAPRTDLIDASDPQSYQPLAVADALLSLSLASPGDLRVHAVDVNPRVVRAVQSLSGAAVTWHVFSGITDAADRSLSGDYRDYLRRLGRTIGDEQKAPRDVASDRHYQHSIVVRPDVARVFSAERLNVITERLASPFDLIVITNVLPYFDDHQVALAVANLSAMLGPGGYLIHNEPRPVLGVLAAAAGMPVVQMRTAILGGPVSRDTVSRPLYDAIWIHRRTSPCARDC